MVVCGYEETGKGKWVYLCRNDSPAIWETFADDDCWPRFTNWWNFFPLPSLWVGTSGCRLHWSWWAMIQTEELIFLLRSWLSRGAESVIFKHPAGAPILVSQLRWFGKILVVIGNTPVPFPPSLFLPRKCWIMGKASNGVKRPLAKDHALYDAPVSLNAREYQIQNNARWWADPEGLLLFALLGQYARLPLDWQ